MKVYMFGCDSVANIVKQDSATTKYYFDHDVNAMYEMETKHFRKITTDAPLGVLAALHDAFSD